MLAALIIVFREIIEAGLIIGIALAVTKGVPGAMRWIIGGVLAGVLGSCVLAIFTGAVSSAFQGMGQELFNATILGLAVLMLGWHNIWMARHGRELAADMKAAGRDVATGVKGVGALAVVVGVAVLREGAEVVLFLYGIVVSGHESAAQLLLGGFGGLALGAAFTVLTYIGLVHIPLRHLFAVTSALIAFLAAGMAAQSVAFLESAGKVTALDQTVWNSSRILSEDSVVGRVLHTLIGYMDRPTAMELVVYLVVLAIIFGLGRVMRPKPFRRSIAT
ncbi:MAG: FTR1 family protein [Paracoccaceae bacterium]